jgi:plasmid stabilization system protein ParE
VTFRVRLTREAEADLDRLFDFVLERELERDGGDLSLAEQAVTAIRAGFTTLKTSPPSSRSNRRPMWWWLPCGTNSKTTITDTAT